MKKKVKVVNCCELEDCESSEYSADFLEDYKKFVQIFLRITLTQIKKLKNFNFFYFKNKSISKVGLKLK